MIEEQEEQEQRKEFWEKNWQNFLTPKGERWPEGFDVLDWLRSFFIDYSSIVEYGCGDGRLSPAFPHDRYLGIDFNKNVIEAARKNNPKHKYVTGNKIAWNPEAVLFYTVLLHNPDEEIERIIEESQLLGSDIVIAEVIKKEREQGGRLPVFGHSVRDYERLFYKWELRNVVRIPYKWYLDTNISILQFKY